MKKDIVRCLIFAFVVWVICFASINIAVYGQSSTVVVDVNGNEIGVLDSEGNLKKKGEPKVEKKISLIPSEEERKKGKELNRFAIQSDTQSDAKDQEVSIDTTEYLYQVDQTVTEKSSQEDESLVITPEERRRRREAGALLVRYTEEMYEKAPKAQPVVIEEEEVIEVLVERPPLRPGEYRPPEIIPVPSLPAGWTPPRAGEYRSPVYYGRHGYGGYGPHPGWSRANYNGYVIGGGSPFIYIDGPKGFLNVNQVEPFWDERGNYSMPYIPYRTTQINAGVGGYYSHGVYREGPSFWDRVGD